MMKRYLFAAAATIALPASAFSQDLASTKLAGGADSAPTASPTAGSSEIIVTSTRRKSTLQSTPVTVSALTTADLATYNITRVDQVAAQVPNFYMQPGVANSSTVSLAMRGHGDNSGGFGTTEQPVSFYFDDVYQARPSAVNSEFTDIERIEVLRGPQGTLFGRNSMMGAVNIISRTPADTTYGAASLSYGNYDTFKAKGLIGGPLIDGVLAGSVSALYTNQGVGYMHDLATGKSIDRRDFLGGRTTLHYYGSKIWDVVVRASYTDSKNDGFVTSPVNGTTLLPITGDYRDTISPLDSYGRTKTTAVSGQITGSFDAVTVKSITGWSKVNDGWLVDLTGGMISDSGKYVTGYSRRSDLHQDQISEELQGFGDVLDKKLSWIGGFYFFHETTSQSFVDNFYYPAYDVFLGVPKISYTNRAYSYAGYAQLSYKITDKLEAVVGGRYTSEDKSISGLVDPTTPYANHTSFNAFTPKFGLNYRATPDIFLYSTISEGFKAGGYTSGSSTVLVAETPFQPETVWAYEVGAKTDWLERRVRLNLALFYNDFKDVLVGRFLDNSAVVVEYNGESYDVGGAELELNVRPVAGLNVYLNGGLQHASNFQFVEGAQITVPTRIPHYSGSTGFRYEFPVWTGESLRFGADYTFRDHIYGAVDQTPISLYSRISELNAEVTLINANGWQVSATGRNLTNHIAFQNSLDLVSFLGVGSRQPTVPRTYAVELSYKF